MAQNLKKILLVDDDDDLREALGEQLIITEDFDVFEAANGAETMEKVKQGIYDLVILDVGLPDNLTTWVMRGVGVTQVGMDAGISLQPPHRQ